jgi:hypothetical protein
MKKLITGLTGFAASLALFATSGSVMAAGVYTLTDVGAWNTYTVKTSTLIPTLTSGPIPFGGTATVTAGGAFAATSVQHSFVGNDGTYNYTDGVWSGVVGGTSVTHSENCVEVDDFADSCSNGTTGLTGIWGTNVRNDGGADEANCYGANLIGAPDQCNAILITENPGASFVVWEQSAFAAPYSASGFRYTFTTAVPIPAAVWLFSSALGLLGWMRHKTD